MYGRYLEKLRSVLLFESMNTEEIGKVLMCLNGRVKNYEKNEYIHVQGDTFSEIGIVIEGEARIVKEWIDGAYSDINHLKECDTFGEDIICSGSGCCPYSILAVASTVIIYIDGGKLVNPQSTQCQYRSQVNLNMLKRIAEYSMYLNKKVEYARIISLKKRVATFIYDIYESKNSDTFSIDMNREQMASYLNATRPAVSKILIQYKKDHIIDYCKDKFTMINEAKLIEEIS